MILLQLTTSTHYGDAPGGARVILPLGRLDHLEQREGRTYVRTAGGADLYVDEPVDEILAQIQTTTTQETS